MDLGAVAHPLEAPPPHPFASPPPAQLVRSPAAQVYGLARLQQLARQGAWRALLERARELQALHTPGTPRSEALGYAAYVALAHAKLRQWGAAADTLRATGCCGAAAASPPDAADDEVPWALHALQCESLFHTVDARHGLQALTRLHERSRDAERAAAAASDLPAAARWRRRRDATLCGLISHLCVRGEHAAALQWLHERSCDGGAGDAAAAPVPVWVHALGALLLLQLGDVAGARTAVGAAEEAARSAAAAAATDPGVVAEDAAAVARARALLRLAERDYAGAREALEAAAAARPGDAGAANDAAALALHCGDLGGATRALERALQAAPLAMASEPLTASLCTAYEAAAADPDGARRQLASWISRLGVDDFDAGAAGLQHAPQPHAGPHHHSGGY